MSEILNKLPSVRGPDVLQVEYQVAAGEGITVFAETVKAVVTNHDAHRFNVRRRYHDR